MNKNLSSYSISKVSIRLAATAKHSSAVQQKIKFSDVDIHFVRERQDIEQNLKKIRRTA